MAVLGSREWLAVPAFKPMPKRLKPTFRTCGSWGVYAGPLCQVCEEGMTRDYLSSTDACRECPAGWKIALTTLGLLLGAFSRYPNPCKRIHPKDKSSLMHLCIVGFNFISTMCFASCGYWQFILHLCALLDSDSNVRPSSA